MRRVDNQSTTESPGRAPARGSLQNSQHPTHEYTSGLEMFTLNVPVACWAQEISALRSNAVPGPLEHLSNDNCKKADRE